MPVNWLCVITSAVSVDYTLGLFMLLYVYPHDLHIDLNWLNFAQNYIQSLRCLHVKRMFSFCEFFTHAVSTCSVCTAIQKCAD